MKGGPKARSPRQQSVFRERHSAVEGNPFFRLPHLITPAQYYSTVPQTAESSGFKNQFDSTEYSIHIAQSIRFTLHFPVHTAQKSDIMPGFFFTKGLNQLGLAQSTLTEYGHERTPPHPDPCSSEVTQLAERIKTLHEELSATAEESTDWSEVDKKMLALIGAGVEHFGEQTGQNIDMEADTTVPESMGDLTEEHKALFQGIKRLIYARQNMTAASQCDRTQQVSRVRVHLDGMSCAHTVDHLWILPR